MLQGTCTVRDSFVFSEHGSGVVVMRQGAAVLERCRVDHCGHYGIGADGPGVLVDCRQTVPHPPPSLRFPIRVPLPYFSPRRQTVRRSRARARARGWV